MTRRRQLAVSASLAIAVLVANAPFAGARAESTGDLSRESNEALSMLYRTHPAAATVSRSAVAILIFPKIIKAGLVFGGAFGEGELRQGDKVDGYYNSITGSWGLQAGAQSYGYAVFLMNHKALDYIHKSAGWEIGVGPTVVVVDEGVAKNLSSSTLKGDAYAFIFDQQGLMAGISIEGTKITKIKQ